MYLDFEKIHRMEYVSEEDYKQKVKEYMDGLMKAIIHQVEINDLDNLLFNIQEARRHWLNFELMNDESSKTLIDAIKEKMMVIASSQPRSFILQQALHMVQEYLGIDETIHQSKHPSQMNLKHLQWLIQQGANFNFTLTKYPYEGMNLLGVLQTQLKYDAHDNNSSILAEAIQLLHKYYYYCQDTSLHNNIHHNTIPLEDLFHQQLAIGNL